MFFFTMKSLQVGDFRDEIKMRCEIRAILFFYHMRHLRQQIATACAAYASNGLLQAQHTLAIGYGMRSIRQQSTEYLTICYPMRSVRQQIATVYVAYACKLLQHAKHMLAISYHKRSVRQQSATILPFCFSTTCAIYASKLLRHAQHTLAMGYRMRSIRQHWLRHAHALAKHRIFDDLLPYVQCTLANCYCMHSICLQIVTACKAYASNQLP